MILPNNTTVAVVDGERLRLFRNKGQEPHIKLVALDTPDLVPEKSESDSHHKNGGANPDGSRQDEERFAAATIDHLNRQVLGGHISQLYIIADPRTLGEMRRHYHVELKSRLIGELAKDFTAHPVEAIETALLKA